MASAPSSVISGNANTNDNADDGDNTDEAEDILLDFDSDDLDLGPRRPSSSIFGPGGYDPLPTSRFPDLGALPSDAPIISTPATDSSVVAAPVSVPVRPPASAPVARATPSTLPAAGDVGPRTLAGIVASLGMISLGVGLRLRRRRAAARAGQVDADPAGANQPAAPPADNEDTP